MTNVVVESGKTAVNAAWSNVKKFAIPLLVGVFILALLGSFIPFIKNHILGY